MKKWHAHAILLSALLSLASTGSAQTLANVFFPDIEKVQAASGLILTKDRAISVPANWSYDNLRKGVLLTISLPNNVAPSSAMVSGVIIDDNSQLNFSPISIADLGNPRAFVPACEGLPEVSADSTQEGLFSQLVEIRQRRIEVSTKKLRETVSPELFERLRQLEKGFNIEGEKPLSLDLPLEELATRLDTLYHTVSRYEFYKGRRDTEVAIDSRLQSSAQ